MNTLVTLHRLRRHLGLDATDTGDDDRLLDAIKAAIAAIERETGRRFTPYQASIPHSIDLHDSSEIILRGDLLQVEAVTHGSSQSVSLNDIAHLPPGSDAPAGVLRLINGEGFVYDESPINAVTVTGIWGWHDDWPQAWISSGDRVSDETLSASSQHIYVSDADGPDIQGQSPRFQVGGLIRIDREYMRILSVDTAADSIAVLRGVNGSQAAAHAINAPIDCYEPPEDVAWLALELATRNLQTNDQARPLDAQPLRLLQHLRRLSA